MPRPRDSQRSKVYRAVGELQRAATFDLLSADAFVRSVLESRLFKKDYPHITKYRVITGRGRARALLQKDVLVVSLPGWAQNPITVLLVLAFAMIPKDAAWHGREYAGALLKLMELKLPTEGALLKAAYEKHNVKYKPKRVRKPLTPEQREELKKRLVVARVVRRIKRAVAG